MFNPLNKDKPKPPSFTEALGFNPNSAPHFFNHSPQRVLGILRKTFSQIEPSDDFKLPIKGLQYEGIPGDGNCLFNAIFLYVTDPKIKDQQDLRRLAHDFLKNNFEQYSPFFELKEGQTARDYLDKILQNGVWGTNVEVMALMFMLKRPIYVIEKGKIMNAEQVFSVGVFNEPPIFLYFNGLNHYDAMRLDDTVAPSQIIASLLGSVEADISSTNTAEKTLLDQGLCTGDQLARLKAKEYNNQALGPLFLSYLLRKDSVEVLKNKHLNFEQVLMLPTPGHFLEVVKLYTLYPAEIVKEHLKIEEIAKLSYWDFIVFIDRKVDEVKSNEASVQNNGPRA